MSKVKKEDVERICQYLLAANRPYSVNDVFENLKRESGLGKTAVQKIIDQLVAEKKITEKAYGKTKIFYSNQAVLDKLPAEKLAANMEKIKAQEEELRVINGEIRDLEAQMKISGSRIPLEVIQANGKKIDDELQLLIPRLEKLKEKAKDASGGKAAAGGGGGDFDINKAQRDDLKFRKMAVEYKTRKGRVMDIVDSLSEKMEKTRQETADEMGVELIEPVKLVL